MCNLNEKRRHGKMKTRIGTVSVSVSVYIYYVAALVCILTLLNEM